MRVAFAYPTNRTALLKAVLKGKDPDNALYGYNYIVKEDKYLCEVSQTAERILNLFFYPISLIFLKQIDIDFKLARAILMISKLNKADVIVSNIDGMSLAICFLKRLKLVRALLVYSVGLFYIQGKLDTALESKRETLFLKFYKWILTAADQILYHSPIEKEKLKRLKIYNPETCTFVPMGSDNIFFNLTKFRRTEPKETLVVSVGKDRARDYKTLLLSAAMLPSFKFIVVCRKDNIAGLKIPKNVEIYFELQYQEVAALYQKSTIAVIPIREMNRSSGQMTLTDSIQTKIPIIISNVVGISHYPLKDGFNVIKVPPQNPKLLKEAIEKLIKDKSLQSKLIKNSQSLARQYTTKRYAQDLAAIINSALDLIKLKPVDRDDIEFMRRIRNENRNFFISRQILSRKDQQRWFENYRKKDNDFTYIFKKADKRLGVGSIYNINNNKRNANIGRFVIDKTFQNQGYGKILLRKIEQIGFDKMGMETLNLEVLSDNISAIKLYKQAGFIKQKDTIRSGKKVTIMIKHENSPILAV